MDWSRESLKDMTEIEHRVLVQMRFDEISDHCKGCSKTFVTKSYFWKTLAGYAIAVVGALWGFLKDKVS